MNSDNNTISCLWIQKKLDKISTICINSWLKLGYNVNIYTYSILLNFQLCNPITHNKKIKILDARDIYDGEDDFLPCSDRFRFELLDQSLQVNDSVIWCDTDQFLLKRLPKGTYVSSEHCKKIGAFSPKNRDLTANIGVISQEEKIIDWRSIINKIDKKTHKQNSNKNCYMKIYQDLVHKNHMDIVKPPEMFCPIPWAFAKEIYTNTDIEGNKFGIRCSWQSIKNSDSVYGIHLWRNLKNTKQYDLKEDSVYEQIEDMLNEKHYKICIPSYNRCNLLKSHTMKLLEQYNFVSITVFCSTVEDFVEYSKLYRNVVLVPPSHRGIGKKRSYIINKWAKHNDKIIMMDDDIDRVVDDTGKDVNLKPFFKEFFERLEEQQLHLGGMVLCSNPFFMKRTWTTTLKYTSGVIQFYRVDKTKEEIHCLFNHFEDYYYNIRYFRRDGGILRCNFVCPLTKCYNTEGGICAQAGGLENRLKEAEKNADLICSEYKGMVKKYYKKKGRNPACVNLRLNHCFKM